MTGGDTSSEAVRGQLYNADGSKAGAEFLVAPLERMTTPLSSPETSGAQAIVVLAAGRLQEAPEYGGRDIPDYIQLWKIYWKNLYPKRENRNQHSIST